MLATRRICCRRILNAIQSKTLSSTTTIDAPTRDQLWTVAIRAGIPMIGFGFMDNRKFNDQVIVVVVCFIVFFYS
jgi:hypothetical protein